MYVLVMTINHHYLKYNCKHYHVRQAKKEALESYSQKQEKASTAGSTTASQSKANTSLVASSAKSSLSKPSLFLTSKKQPNSSWVDFSSKLASNGKLTSDEHKKHLEHNLCLYCGVEDYKLDSYPKK